MPPTVTTTPLRELAPGLWDVEQVRRVAGANQRLRMTVIRLSGGGLWLYSPVEIDDQLAQQLAAAGEVAHVVAPNRYHHLVAGAAKRRYSAATLWAVPGLPEKRGDLRFDRVLGSDLPWSGDLDTLVLTSVPKFNESLFFHRSSRTLICADFFFNIRAEQSFMTRLVYRLLGVYRRPAQSRFFRKCIDRRACRPQLEAILAWDIQRICMAHGDVLDERAGAILAEVVAPFRA
jgi:hypothetical protein